MDLVLSEVQSLLGGNSRLRAVASMPCSATVWARWPCHGPIQQGSSDFFDMPLQSSREL